MENSGNQSVSLVQAQDDTNHDQEPASACTGCRRRKLKCSKEVPKCQQCRKSGGQCVYDNKRNKSGMKAGAIEGLHRRLDALEKRVEEIEGCAEPSQDSHSSNVTPAARNAPDTYTILSSLAKELRRFSEEPHQHDPRRLSAPSGQVSPGVSAQESDPPRKRRRINVACERGNCRYQIRPCEGISDIPDERPLNALLKAYFSHVHPWIPMIHEGRLRKRLSGDIATAPEQYQRLQMLLTAIRLVSARFIKDHEVASSCTEATDERQSQVRDWVILQAMKGPSVESLQALILLAYDDIGGGEATLAWPIIGSLTRTAEYLQLTVEHGIFDHQAQPLVRPYTLLTQSQDWTQDEERRRVFWTIFNLDRYCSVTMGWNTSLTSHDVNRRLPCDGITWRKEDPVETPFFGIWDKEAGRIGNPIAFLPTHAAHSPQHHRHVEDHIQAPASTPSAAGSTPGASFPSPTATTMDMSAVGAFAYSIEATESLSRVNTYFLQQKGVRNKRDLPSWLMRFKELDLRLVHWKMFLPQKWKADNVTARPGSRMDPNLTLAHVTHNASMILLHQVIAFPLPEWDFFKQRLPSALSIDTCHAAAVEIEVISRNFLKCTKAREEEETMPVSVQFAFCVYVAARFLLVFWRAREGRILAPEFQTLLSILHDMAQRWSGPYVLEPKRKGNLAAKYMQQLSTLHAKCIKDDGYRIDPLSYTTDMDHPTCGTEGRDKDSDGRDYREEPTSINHVQASNHMQHNHSYPGSQQANGSDIAFQGLPEFPQIQKTFPPQIIPHTIVSTAESENPRFSTSAGQAGSRAFTMEHQQPGSLGTGDVGMISQMLMNQQFMDLDRVISFDDGMFGSEFDGEAW